MPADSLLKRLSFTGGLITLVGSIFFSTKAVIVKYAFWKTQVDVVSLLALRMLFSLPFYLVGAWIAAKRAGDRKLTKYQWGFVLAMGIFGYYLSTFLDFWGLKYISAGLERLILFLYPTFVVLINAFYFKEQISKRQKFALALTYSGTVLAYAGELTVDSGNPNFLLGSILIFACAITFAIYTVGSGRLIPAIGAGRFTSYVMLASSGGIFIHYLLKGDYSIFHSGNQMIVYGILLAVIATVIPSFMISYGTKKIGANNVAIIASIGPVSTILQAYIVLHEPIYTAQIIGTVLVVTGVVMVGWKRAGREP